MTKLNSNNFTPRSFQSLLIHTDMLFNIKKTARAKPVLTCLIIIGVCLICGTENVSGQDPWKKLESRPSTLGLEKGTTTFKTPQFSLKLVKASQTVAALSPSTDTLFDFTPGERLKLRSSDQMYHLGDLNIRLKVAGQTTWTAYSTATKRAEITPLHPTEKNVLASADLSNTLPANIPIKIERDWKLIDGHLVLLFKLKNTSGSAIELGSLGIPMIFNNILQGKTLEETHATNVFYDPYIGEDAGYLQVTRLNGHGPVLLVVPFGKTPFEAYNPLLSDPTPRGIDFEGFYEWMTYSKAYADKEWKDAEPWNKPSSVMINPGETKEYGVKFLLADAIKHIESTLTANQRPVAIGIPGYVLPMNVDAKLFLKYDKKVSLIQAEPRGALTVKAVANASYQEYSVSGKIWGRARLAVTYQDGLVQTIQYKVIKPEAEVLKDYGRFFNY